MQEEKITIREVLEKYYDWNILFCEINDFGIEFILSLEHKKRKSIVQKVHNLMFDLKNKSLKVLKKDFLLEGNPSPSSNYQEVK